MIAGSSADGVKRVAKVVGDVVANRLGRYIGVGIGVVVWSKSDGDAEVPGLLAGDELLVSITAVVAEGSDGDKSLVDIPSSSSVDWEATTSSSWPPPTRTKLTTIEISKTRKTAVL